MGITKKKVTNNTTLNVVRPLLILCFVLLTLTSVFAAEPIVVRTISANPATRTYTFACLDNGSGLSGTGVRKWTIYPEDTNQLELNDLALPYNQTLTYTFNRTAYYNVACIVPNPPGLNYSSNYRHDLHIDLSTKLLNPAIIPNAVAPGSMTVTCQYNGTNYTLRWMMSTYAFNGGGLTNHTDMTSANYGTLWTANDSTNKTITFFPPTTPGLFDTHCLIHLNGPGTDIDMPWGVDFPTVNATPYIADQQGIATNGQYLPFNAQTWLQLHTGASSANNSNSSNSSNNVVKLTVLSTPTGTLIVNGTVSGTTPATLNLTIGSYLVSVSAPGFITNTTVVSLSTNTTVNLSLQPVANVSNQTCFTKMQTIPANCTGTITNDSIQGSGCRLISCTSGAGSLQAQVCNKPGDYQPQYFEMHTLTSSGNQPTLCIGSACVGPLTGFVRSSNFPVCVGTPNVPNVTLTVLSQQAANVTINGTFVGVSPLAVSLQPGTYVVTLTTFGRQPSVNTVVLTNDFTLNVTLQSTFVSLNVFSTPSASFALNGVVVGTTPLTLSLPPEIYQYNFSALGFQSFASSLFLNVNSTLNVTLQPLANGSNQTCYNGMQSVPANCIGGTIVNDSIQQSGCRLIICTNASNMLQAQICNKPGDYLPQYFEMNNFASSGNTPTICLLGTCIGPNSGYARSPNFPICTGANPVNVSSGTNVTLTVLSSPTASVSINGTALGNTPIARSLTPGTYSVTVSASGYVTNTTAIVVTTNMTWNVTLQQVTGTNQTCYANMQSIPATCPDGAITNDSIQQSGCRFITCTNGANMQQVQVCNKPGDFQPQFFEMHTIASAGTPTTICLAGLCTGALTGFVSSGNFPVCTNTTIPPQTGSLALSISAGFPQNVNYSFTCTPSNIIPTGYDWNFGDGSTLTNTQSNVQLHTYSPGAYVASCTASGTNITSSLPVAVISSSNQTCPLPQIVPPFWFEPGATGVYPNDFHLHVSNTVDTQNNVVNPTSADYEIWDTAANQLVWYSYKETADPYHIHRGDGIFTGSLTGQNVLAWNTTYQVRMRLYTNLPCNNISNWTVWHTFQTLPPINITPTATSWTPAPGYTISKVTGNISLPISVIVAPNLYSNVGLPLGKQPMLYVTQLYGQVGVIAQDGTYRQYAGNLLGAPPPGGVPGGGEAGVDGIYADNVTGDLWVGINYVDGTSITGMSAKIVHFKTNATGDGFTASNTIIDKIPVRPSHMAHTILKGADGKLYLSVGDADQLTWPQDPTKFGGKVLRMNFNGSIPSDNPFPGTYTYALGFRNPYGMAFRPGTNELYVSNNGQDTDDGLYKTFAGSQFGWPNSLTQGVWYGWPVEIAPTQVGFDKFNTFPNDSQSVFIVGSGSTYLQGPSPNSKRILRIGINSDGSHGTATPLITYTGAGFGDPIGLAFAPEGAYFTDIYGDAGFTGAGVTQGNVYKIVYTGQNGTTQNTTNTTNQTNVSFGAVIAQHPWYPKTLDSTRTDMIWDCKVSGGTGPFTYDYFYGDGNQLLNYNQNTAENIYQSHGTFNASCTVHDAGTGLSATGSTQFVT